MSWFLLIRKEVIMFKRILAIGDIHGQYNKLINLWEQIDYNDNEDFLVFLGDYIDRGEYPIECLSFVRDLVHNNKNVHALLGNHEDMFMEYYDDNELHNTNNYYDWVRKCNGGDITLRKFQEHMISYPSEMNDIIDFIYNDLKYINNDIPNVLFVHAGVNPRTYHLGKQNPFDLLWIRNEFLNNYHGDDLIVVGHTPVQMVDGDNQPLLLDNNIVMLDTGSFVPDGKITCMDIKTKEYWQA